MSRPQAPADADSHVTRFPKTYKELAEVEGLRAELDAQIKAAATIGDEDDDEPDDEPEALSPAELAALKKQLTVVKKQQKAMQQELIIKLGKARAELSADQERDLVLLLAKNDVMIHLDGYITAHRQRIIATLESWWDKYAVPLRQIEADRNVAAINLARFLEDLGYE